MNGGSAAGERWLSCTAKYASAVQFVTEVGTAPRSSLPLTQKVLRDFHAPISSGMVPLRFDFSRKLKGS